MTNKYRYAFQWHTDTYGWGEAFLLKYPGDVYIEVLDMFGCEDDAMNILFWAEQANPGDVYEDDDLRITAL